MISINTNYGSLFAAKSASASQSDMNKAMERLSSGLRINYAKDDAAGQGIATRLSAEIKSLEMASRNASDAQAMVDTADAAHQEVHSMLLRMREIAVQAVNGTLNDADRTALNTEMTALETEITKIADNTSFGGVNLGTSGVVVFQVGPAKGTTITHTFADFDATKIGATGSVDTATNAAAAISLIDDAISLVSTRRGELGALSNRLTSTIANMDNIELWKDFIEYNPEHLLLDFTVLKKWFILLQRVNGLNQILIKNLENSEEHLIKFEDEAYELSLLGQYEFDTNLIRISYSSPITPSTVYDYDCNLRQKIHRKTQEIPSGHNSKDYICKRVMVIAYDQEEIPLTIFYHKNTKLNGKAPLLLYGYGSYGITIPDNFSSNRFTLVNRGFIYAVAHIRGGREKGQEWYENGKLMNKKNTFLDFISCAEYLCKNNFTSKGKIIAQGGSAGGLLMGYISNERPDLFLGIIAQVPFVDICNTMLDEDLPLTVTEIPEWGDIKKDEKAFKYIKSYSPYDNVKKQNYPNMLITGGITDPRVTYWEMTKWIAKLRDFKTDENLIILDMNMDAGHSGASGRYDYLKEVALTYIFALKISNKISP